MFVTAEHATVSTMNTPRFSERHGFAPAEVEITVRHDAPDGLRGVVLSIAYECGLSPKPLRGLVCRVLRTRPDSGNWSEWPNVAEEVEGLVDGCEWFEVYDIIEAVHDSLQRLDERGVEDGPRAARFTREMNAYFRKAGIGWQLVDGRLEVRGPETFEETVKAARDALAKTGRTTAGDELHEALCDLSRRPEPDITGAIQHAMAALECVARDVTGDEKATLGEILKRHPGLLPAPLDVAVEKVWGYASERGRHLREGREPETEEAELLVGVAGAAATYLVRRLPRSPTRRAPT